MNNAPSWADQWGATNDGDDNPSSTKTTEDSKKNKKLETVKAAASTGFGKAKAAAAVGAQKVKSGTSFGSKWLKTQYQKRSSK
ncbi:hypothetical protein QJS10_CPA01g00875 [Acorus calamus]|uniref:Uncharacterized protein n=1 Tax=Acorus calamus TaxID=4465 RepID=A0AAV9FRX7_ACOCL|nr:hypothetical protein QJS10_CPA01g00875 [Acorus calamus]